MTIVYLTNVKPEGIESYQVVKFNLIKEKPSLKKRQSKAIV
jgi:hypothetical protein